jgi:hypothetical protein
MGWLLLFAFGACSFAIPLIYGLANRWREAPLASISDCRHLALSGFIP